MIWLRLLIAVIALTISSDLSAWAQPQMQVNSPEGFYDCKGIANGANDRDPEGGCCLQSERTEAPCFLCIYKPNFCDKQTGVCRTTTTADMNKRCCDAHPFPCNDCNRPTMTFCELQLNQCNTTATPDKNNTCCSAHPSPCNDCKRPSMTPCETELNQCGATAVCGKCGGTMGGCGRCEGCHSCDVSRCQDPGTGVNPAYQCSGSDRLGHGVRAVRIDHISPQRGSQHLYSTDPDAEAPLKPGSGFNHSRTKYICNDGTMVPE